MTFLFLSVISGVGELDLDKTEPNPVDLMPVSSPNVQEKPYPDCPYLLLDVRERDLYDQCHIISGKRLLHAFES